MDSTSRWLVGSSRTSRFARGSIIIASATRARSPPESVRRLPLHLVAGEAEAAEVALDEPALPERPQVVDHVVERLVERTCAGPGGSTRRWIESPTLSSPALRAALADDRLEQRGLAGAVRADEPDPIAARDARR